MIWIFIHVYIYQYLAEVLEEICAPYQYWWPKKRKMFGKISWHDNADTLDIVRNRRWTLNVNFQLSKWELGTCSFKILVLYYLVKIISRFSCFSSGQVSGHCKIGRIWNLTASFGPKFYWHTSSNHCKKQNGFIS